MASTARRITVAVFAMWLARVAAIACSLLLMPILFSRLPKPELGVWLLLGQSGNLILLLDFGLTSTLIRRFAFLHGDATASGGAGEEHVLAFQRLAATGRRLYRMIALGVGVVAWLGGLGFIGSLEIQPVLLHDARIAWTIICAGQMIALSNGLWTAAISGLGHVATVSLMSVGFTILTILAQCGAALSGGGLVALATTGAVGSIAMRTVAVRYLRRKEPALARLDGRWERAAAVSLMAPSLKYFVTEIGALALMRTDQYFIAGYLDPASLPNYVAGYTLAFNAAVISIAIGDAGNVYVSQLWRAQTRERIRGIVLRSMRIGLGLMALGVAVLLFAGSSIISAWLGAGHFVGLPVIATVSAMFLVHTQQSLLFGFSRATENEVYARWFLAAGALNIGLSFILAPTLGLVGIALATLIAQIATTGWHIPLSALRRLEIPVGLYLRHVVGPIAVLFGAACASVWLVAAGPLAPGAVLEKIAMTALAAALVGAAGFWTLILDGSLRERALAHIGFRSSREIRVGE